jgi:hypothetical protein
MDLAVLFASCLEHIRLNPVIFHIVGHTLFGYFPKEEDSLPQMISAKWGDVVKLINEKKIIAVNTTSFPEGFSYDKSKEDGRDYIADRVEAAEEFRCVIDIKKARDNGYRPMPLE